jgi:U3 small nucleolar RNA-associated protein 22
MTACLSLADIQHVQYEAKRSFAYLCNTGRDMFEPLFLKSIKHDLLQFDHLIRLNVATMSAPTTTYTMQHQLDHPDYADFVRSNIPDVLVQALTDRVHCITVQLQPLPSSLVKTSPMPSTRQLTIGFNLNASTFGRQIDRGPSPEDKEGAASFRALWGDRAELRRFKDGAILESIVWNPTTEHKESKFLETVVYLLERHFSVAMEQVELAYGEAIVDAMIAPTKPVKQLYGATQSFLKVVQEYDEFTKVLRNLQGLPLAISAVVPLAAGLRYASIYPPAPISSELWKRLPNTAKYVEPMDVHIQLESSSSWPDDVRVIQKTKVAFYLALKDVLVSEHKSYQATIVSNLSSDALVEMTGLHDYLDVVTGSGYVFRIRIHHERELQLLDAQLKNKTATALTLEQCRAAKDVYTRLFVHLPAHTLQVQAACQRFVSLSGTIRLLKRWLSSHLFLRVDQLGTGVPQELAERLSMAIYTNPAPWPAAATPWTGFLRVLNLLATWNFVKEPILLDVEGTGLDDTTTMACDAIVQRHLAHMQQLEVLGESQVERIIVATQMDQQGGWWDEHGQGVVSGVLLARLQAMAKASLNAIDKASSIQGDHRLKLLKSIFVPPMTDFDAVLECDPTKCTRYHQQWRPDGHLLHATPYKNLMQPTTGAMMVGFDPIEVYCRDLEALFGPIAWFFRDAYGGTSIAIVWKRNVIQHDYPFKASLPFSTEPVWQAQDIASLDKVRQTKRVKANLTDTLAQIVHLGSGLVQNVTTS